MEEILNIAKLYIEKLNKEKPIHSDYQYSINKVPIEFYTHWYFNFKIVSINPKIEKVTPGFAGAPGFLISKINKNVKMISLGILNELKETKSRHLELDRLFLEFNKNGKWKNSKIKIITGLKPIEIINAKNKFKTLDLSIEKNRLSIITHLEKLISRNKW